MRKKASRTDGQTDRRTDRQTENNIPFSRGIITCSLHHTHLSCYKVSIQIVTKGACVCVFISTLSTKLILLTSSQRTSCKASIQQLTTTINYNKKLKARVHKIPFRTCSRNGFHMVWVSQATLWLVMHEKFEFVILGRFGDLFRHCLIANNIPSCGITTKWILYNLYRCSNVRLHRHNFRSCLKPESPKHEQDKARAYMCTKTTVSIFQRSHNVM